RSPSANDAIMLARTVLMGARQFRTRSKRHQSVRRARWQCFAGRRAEGAIMRKLLRSSILENGLRCAYSQFRGKKNPGESGERSDPTAGLRACNHDKRNRCVCAVWLESR